MNTYTIYKEQEDTEFYIELGEYLSKGDNLSEIDMEDILYNYNILPLEVIKAITSIYGSNKENYENMLYYATGYRTFQQYLEVLYNE